MNKSISKFSKFQKLIGKAPSTIYSVVDNFAEVGKENFAKLVLSALEISKNEPKKS